MMLRQADPSLGPNTLRADRESLVYARRAFGALPVQKLTPAALADWSAKLTGKGGATLAPATKRRAIVRLKSVLAHARKMRWLTYDPSADLESPEQKGQIIERVVFHFHHHPPRDRVGIKSSECGSRAIRLSKPARLRASKGR